MTIARKDDFAELGLPTDGSATEEDIRKAYLVGSKKLHPDRPGGCKESFQRLSNAYLRLIGDENYVYPNEASASAPAWSESAQSEYEAYWRQEQEDFFYGWDSFFGCDDVDEDDEEYFRRWTWDAKYRARQRREEIKRKYDSRDRKALPKHTDKCMFCGHNRNITESQARESGMNWTEYVQHPRGYRTCWACLKDHTSVMTEAMALKKFAKKLDYTFESKRTGRPYRPVFWFAQCGNKTFHYQPRLPGQLTRNSRYYWYPDLEEEALHAGWKPRGKKKEEVPWRRKDADVSSDMVLKLPCMSQVD